jgi:hypothetical protein
VAGGQPLPDRGGPGRDRWGTDPQIRPRSGRRPPGCASVRHPHRPRRHCNALPQHDALSSIQTGQWVLLLALGTLATAIPFTSFIIAAQVNSAARLGVAGYLVPVIAVTLAVVFLGEDPTPAVLIGALLIISGVIVTEGSSRHVPVPGVDIAE